VPSIRDIMLISGDASVCAGVCLSACEIIGGDSGVLYWLAQERYTSPDCCSLSSVSGAESTLAAGCSKRIFGMDDHLATQQINATK
jgi:hypothetical protein